MAHRKRPYRAPGTRGPVNESPIEGRDPHGRMNDKGSGNVSHPQYRGPGVVNESPIHVDNRPEHY